ncbi:MAG TPA: hypothetical protein VMH78_03180 [Thermoplasmata archaeon]|nr:hypothetical protein [Thermoplasmata archaeon]
MTDPAGTATGRPPRAAADQEYADAYAEGYGEGLREALREMLEHAARGHTAAEIRLLVQSRLAHLKEDVDLKRRNLLAPPPRAAYAPLFRPAARPVPAPEPAPELEPGWSYLVLEPRPERGPRLVRGAVDRFPRLLVVTFHPPDLGAAAAAKAEVLLVDVPGMGAPGDGALPSDVIAGRIREATERPGGALVYVDALEVMASGGATETMVKFVQWTAQQVARTGSILVASVGPDSFDARVRGILGRSFAREL